MREKIERALQHWLDAVLARIDGRLDNVSLRSKLYSIFVFCVLCPLVLTDSIVMWMLYDTEHKSRSRRWKTPPRRSPTTSTPRSTPPWTWRR